MILVRKIHFTLQNRKKIDFFLGASPPELLPGPWRMSRSEPEPLFEAGAGAGVGAGLNNVRLHNTDDL